ncbi:MAG: S8 family serine peptidase [Planctomycetota bacterium]|nr:S8 family serine peptidase [Planctomycetota bacterium]
MRAASQQDSADRLSACLAPAPARDRERSCERARGWRAFSLVALLALATACGGGGGGDGPLPPEIIDGLAGTILLPDHDLGRVIEQEPNDSQAQPFRLPPVWPRCTLEVTGTFGTSEAWFGRTDPRDVLLFEVVRDQTISLALTFQATDPTSLGLANDFGAEVFRTATGIALGETAPGGQPRTLMFDAAAGETYAIELSATGTGHGWWTVRLTAEDMALVPKPDPTPFLYASDETQHETLDPVAGIAPDQRCAHTHVLVRVRPGCDRDALCRRHGARLDSATGSGTLRVAFDTPTGDDPEARVGVLCAAFAGDPDVEWAEPDWVIRAFAEPGDPEWNRQWNLRAIGVPSAWDITQGQEALTIGVVDSGIVASPDLAGRLVPGFDFVSSAAISGDGNGRDFDPTDPGDRFAADGTSSWHGTHISAIIAANHDDVGMAGIVPRCHIMMLRALGVGGGFVSDAADAILYAAGLLNLPDGTRLATPLRLLNLSIGLPQHSEELREACERAENQGVLLVAAVGNRGGPVEYPAAYPTTFAVAAVDAQLLTTQYSAFGAAVDLAAPGGGASFDADDDGWHDGVLSAVLDETVLPAVHRHAYLVGTSQAAPHVTGVAAMLLSIAPTMTGREVREILSGTAMDLGPPGEDVAYGAGLVQAHEAVKIVLGRVGNPRSDGPHLVLPRGSVQFQGFNSSVEIPLGNGGSGTLNIFLASPLTDDGGDWLSASLVPVLAPSPPVNQSHVTITVDRSRLPPTPGRYSGTVLLSNSPVTHGAVRVVLYVQERTRAGELLSLVAIEDETGIARRKFFALPEFGYRFWMRGLPEAGYRLRGGEDLDTDGFFCEGADACGWLGGPSEAQATVVQHVPGLPALRNLSITLWPPP